MRHLPTIPLLLIVFEIVLLQDASGQQTKSSEVSSVINQLRTGIADTPRVQMLLRLSTIYYQKTLNPISDMDSALMLAVQALDLAQRLKFVNGVEDAIFLKGKIYIRQQDTVKVKQLLVNSSGENCIKLQLELGKSMLRTTYSQKSNRARAMIYFQEARRLSERIGSQKLKEESLSLIGVVYLLNNNWQQGKAHFMQVIEARQQADDKLGEINALLRMATTIFCDNCAENINALKRALELSRQVGDQSLEALIRLELGYKYLLSGDALQAEEEALAAVNIQTNIGYPAVCQAYKALAIQSVYYAPIDYGYLSNAYYLYSDIGQVKGDLNLKLFYILKVVDDAEKSGMLQELDYTYFRLGNAYWELGQFDKSMEYHKKSTKVSHQKGELIQVGLARRIVVALLKRGKANEALSLLHDLVNTRLLLCSVEDKMYIAQSLGSCYNTLEQYTLAEKYYLEGVAWGKQSPLRYQFVAYRGIAQFYIENKQYSLAEPYLKQLLKASREQIVPNYWIEVHLMWFKVDSARQNYPEAIRHYQQYKALQDSIYNETKSRQISQLSIQYETEKNKDEIAILNQKNQLAKNSLDRAYLVRNFTIGATALLFVIIGLLYRQYSFKQQNNKVVLQKNEQLQRFLTEKEWLIKEIHHRVKNNFHIVASLLEIQSNYLKNNEALSAIQETQHRIHAMSIIHQKLYQSETMSTIHMPEYIYELVEYLRDSYLIRENIGFSLQIEKIELNHACATTLGLILNETITNAIKYAFTKKDDGKIFISLNHISDSQFLLKVQDNGPGLPKNFNDKLEASIGMDLLRGLTDDIGGLLSIENNNGTCIKIIFDHKATATKEISVS